MIIAAIVFGGIALVVLLWGLLEERRANKSGNKSGIAALVLSGLGILLTISLLYTLFSLLALNLPK